MILDLISENLAQVLDSFRKLINWKTAGHFCDTFSNVPKILLLSLHLLSLHAEHDFFKLLSHFFCFLLGGLLQFDKKIIGVLIRIEAL